MNSGHFKNVISTLLIRHIRYENIGKYFRYFEIHCVLVHIEERFHLSSMFCTGYSYYKEILYAQYKKKLNNLPYKLRKNFISKINFRLIEQILFVFSEMYIFIHYNIFIPTRLQ
jgi:hypothetical protein